MAIRPYTEESLTRFNPSCPRGPGSARVQSEVQRSANVQSSPKSPNVQSKVGQHPMVGRPGSSPVQDPVQARLVKKRARGGKQKKNVGEAGWNALIKRKKKKKEEEKKELEGIIGCRV